MKSIFSIYFTDIKHITTNWVAAIIIGGLVFLPSLYAWFNIGASWDPYGNTRGIKIAVVNQDKGEIIMNKPINIGKEIIASLQENRSIGWTFMDEKEALSGVKHGDYYAAIIIPSNFSGRIGTVLTHNPVKAEINYYVNEKINAIAPKITSKGASGIIEQVSSNFVKTANGAIFKIFNEVGVELKNELPTIEKVKNLVFKVEQNFPDFAGIINTALNDVYKANDIVRLARSYLPTVTRVAADGQRFSQSIRQLLDYSKDGVNAISPYVKQDLSSLQQTAHAVQQWTAVLKDATADPSLAAKALDHTASRLNAARQIVTGLSQWFDQLNQFSSGKLFKNESAKLGQLRSKLEQQLSMVQQFKRAIQAGEAISDALLTRFNQLSADAAAISSDLLNRYDSTIEPTIKQALNQASSAAVRAQMLIDQAVRRVPEAEDLLKDTEMGLNIGKQGITMIKNDLPLAQEKVTKIANKIRDFEEKGDIQEIIYLLRTNFEKESAFFAEPVILKEHKLYPIPNYGSAMSPFFTTLSLWVGALLLVSLLTVEVHTADAPYRSYQIYFGRYLTFMTLALLQSLFVTIGDIYLLGTYVSDKLWFIAFGLLLSAVFMLIVYTLVSVFGNVGKAMAIVLLVLQLAGSGGTFPIQVTPPFFQTIHPYLPFTYAISMMREATGGIVWDVVQFDFVKMLVYIGITLIIGLALKKPINRSSRAFMHKAKESKLIH